MSFKKIFILGLVILSITGCARNRLYTEKRLLMGTVVEVISPYKEAAKIAFKEIERIEKVFSVYIENSAISHLNETGFLNTNFEVTSLFLKSNKFYEATKREFDITIGPLTEIWREALEKNKLPQESDIKVAKELVGFNNVHIDEKLESIKLMKKGMRVDLGGIAKGYAVDKAVKELKRNGIDSAIINAGGDIYCIGTKFDKPWQIGLQHPRNRDELYDTLELKDLAVVTSGDYERWMEIEGKKYSHIISPKTGYPVESGIISVTVVAKDTITADAVATCVFLLGKDRGTEVFKDYSGVKRIIVITKDDVQELFIQE